MPDQTQDANLSTTTSPAPYAYYEDVNWGLLRLWGARRDARILDVGCGMATTAERLRQLGNHVTGIESSGYAAATAARRLDEVIEQDLRATDEIAARLAGRTFDTILFADVLEHVDWPAPVLHSYLRFLAPQGTVIVSLPNVALWSTRLGLLFGRFDYADTGVLDRTHLRFFTTRSARRLIEDAGLTITRHTYNPGLVRPFVPLAKRLLSPRAPDAAAGAASSSEGQAHNPAALLESRPYKAYLRTLYPVERSIAALWPGLLAFQMIFEARTR
jgi:2-polyprenyl-3-methyl-5-hydroxy-6-metoxy-1,4-benzoquinol methylase